MKTKFLVLVSMLCMVAALMTGCKSYTNVEDYYTKNQAALETAMNLESLKGTMPEGLDIQLSAKGDELIFTCVFDDALMANIDTTAVQPLVDQMAGEMDLQSLADELKTEAKVDNATVSMAFQDSTGNVFASTSAAAK